MFKENKIKMIASFVLTLLPMIIGICLWGKISDLNGVTMRSVKIMSVFVIPVVMLLLDVALVLWSGYEFKKNKQNKKVISVALFIIPVMSAYASLIFYSILLNWNINIQLATSLIMGLLFIVLGNYMPKSKQNRTFGLKIRWTLANEDNWNASHRFGGKVWVVTGFIVLLTGFLPLVPFFIVFISIVLAACIIPTAYSYLYYKNNIKSGKQKPEDYLFLRKKQDKVIAIAVFVTIAVVLVGCAFVMFTGDINIYLDDDSVEIVASYHADESIPYADIDSIEYRENSDKGTRVMGFGSPRLLMGAFKNDELGAFTRFSYTKCKSDIIITVGESKIAISCKTEAETRALYDELLLKLEK